MKFTKQDKEILIEAIRLIDTDGAYFTCNSISDRWVRIEYQEFYDISIHMRDGLWLSHLAWELTGHEMKQLRLFMLELFLIAGEDVL